MYLFVVGWHHRVNGHEFEQAPGDGEGQGSLACRSLWGHRVTPELLNNIVVAVLLLSRVRLFCDPMQCSQPGSSVHGISQARITAVGCHFLLQGIFLTHVLNPRLQHWQAFSLPLSHQGSQEAYIKVIYVYIQCIHMFHIHTHSGKLSKDLKS